MVMDWVTDFSDFGGTESEETGLILRFIDYSLTVDGINTLVVCYISSRFLTLGAANNKVILSMGAVDLLE